MPKAKNNPATTSATVGYKAELWKMADALRGIVGQIARGDTFHDDRHADPKADLAIAVPTSMTTKDHL